MIPLSNLDLTDYPGPENATAVEIIFFFFNFIFWHILSLVTGLSLVLRQRPLSYRVNAAAHHDPAAPVLRRMRTDSSSGPQGPPSPQDPHPQRMLCPCRHPGAAARHCGAHVPSVLRRGGSLNQSTKGHETDGEGRGAGEGRREGIRAKSTVCNTCLQRS